MNLIGQKFTKKAKNGRMVEYVITEIDQLSPTTLFIFARRTNAKGKGVMISAAQFLSGVKKREINLVI